jgi:uncharacterized Fe-S radical SAM superfamily protein PflX
VHDERELGHAASPASKKHEMCHNINLVTPSHVVLQILSALLLAIEGGLSVPLVYNTSGPLVSSSGRPSGPGLTVLG